MADRIRPGAILYVIDLSGLPAGKGRPFALGERLTVHRVTPSGALSFREKDGLWRAHRFSSKPPKE
jgi:hypothetical protein